LLAEQETQDETDAKAERLEKLASFQLQMIQHAFKCTPPECSELTSVSAVKKIVYSTCSIHPEEDEQVVMKALASKEGKARGWTLAPRSMVLPKWHRRGRSAEMGDNEGTQLLKAEN
jgi:putative methyltransferase